jgi:hypothetical protein
MYSHGIGSCVRLFCESVALHWFAAVFVSVCLSTLVGSVCLSESVVRRSCGEEVLWRSVEAGTFLLLLLLSQLYFEKTTIPLLGWSWDLLERERDMVARVCTQLWSTFMRWGRQRFSPL